MSDVDEVVWLCFIVATDLTRMVQRTSVTLMPVIATIQGKKKSKQKHEQLATNEKSGARFQLGNKVNCIWSIQNRISFFFQHLFDMRKSFPMYSSIISPSCCSI